MQNGLIKKIFESLNRFGVRYLLIGGMAVRLHGLNRATEGVDFVLPMDEENGARFIDALREILPSAADLEPYWFSAEANSAEIENIRIADEAIVDILFAPNGHRYEELESASIELEIDGVKIRTLDPAGIIQTKTNYRPKNIGDVAYLRTLIPLRQPKP